MPNKTLLKLANLLGRAGENISEINNGNTKASIDVIANELANIGIELRKVVLQKAFQENDTGLGELPIINEPWDPEYLMRINALWDVVEATGTYDSEFYTHVTECGSYTVTLDFNKRTAQITPGDGSVGEDELHLLLDSPQGLFVSKSIGTIPIIVDQAFHELCIYKTVKRCKGYVRQSEDVKVTDSTEQTFRHHWRANPAIARTSLLHLNLSQ